MTEHLRWGITLLVLWIAGVPAWGGVTVTLLAAGSSDNSVAVNAGNDFSVDIRIEVPDITVTGVQFALQASVANVLDVTGGVYNNAVWDDGVMSLPIQTMGLDLIGAKPIGTVPKAGTIQNSTSLFATVDLAVDAAAPAGTYTLNAALVSSFDATFTKVPGTAGPNFRVIIGGGGGGGLADEDADGVPDSQDACAGTAAGAAVDAVGCSASQRDSDSDGVTDDKDQCVETPAGTTVDANGCPVSQDTDADDDGVTDEADQCPDTPAGVTVDANGCPLPQDTDADDDGVADGADQCPNTPAGTTVGSDGCPVQEPGPPPRVGFCGAGMAESLALSMTALLLVHRRRRHGMPS